MNFIWIWLLLGTLCLASEWNRLNIIINKTNDYDATISHSSSTNGSLVVINVNVFPIAIGRISNMSVEVDLHVSFNWSDLRLLVTRKHSPMFKTLLLTGVEIWKPPIYWTNCIQCYLKQALNSASHSDYLVYHADTFETEISFKETIQFLCPMDFSAYPLDLHTCGIFLNLHIEDARDVNRLKLQHKATFRDEFLYYIIKHIPSEYNFVDYKVHSKCLHTGQDRSECVVYYITFSRAVGYYFLTFYFPTILMVAMAYTSLFIHPGNVTGRLLVPIVAISALLGHYPISRKDPISAYFNAVDVWLSTCVAFATSTLLEYYFAYSVTCKFLETNASKVIKMMRLQQRESTISTEMDHIRKYMNLKNSTDALAKILYPVAFLLFTIPYWTYYLVVRNYKSNTGAFD